MIDALPPTGVRNDPVTPAARPPDRAAPDGATALLSTNLGSHLPAIDGLRGLILFVLLNHYNYLLRAENAVEQVYLATVQLAQLSLDVFFVVSGFLITGILYDSKGGAGYFRTFYIRRTLRIFPLYYAFLAFWFLLLPRLFPWDTSVQVPLERQLWYWTYLTNFFVAYNGGSIVPPHTSHLWSLAVEEQFYLLWPLVVFLVGRRGLMAIAIGCIICAPLFRTALVLNGHTTESTYMLMPARMDSIAVGALLALMARGPRGLHPLARHVRWFLGAVVVVSLAILFVSFWDVRSPVVKTIGYSVAAGFGGGILILALTAPRTHLLPRFLTHPVQRAIGTYAYAIYVFHWPLEYLLAQVGLTPEVLTPDLGVRVLEQLLYSATMILLAIGAGALSWHLFEKHMLKLKSLFPYGRAPAPGRRPDADVGAAAR